MTETETETTREYVPCESEAVDADGERWRPVRGYEGLYEVSEDGRIKSLARVAQRSDGQTQTVRERMLKGSVNSHGYLVVGLSRDGGLRMRPIHQLVAEAFHGKRPTGWDTCHNDGDSLNNHAGNLRFASKSENIRDTVRHGTHRNSRKTQCKWGHELSGGNVYRHPGGRQCRTCIQLRATQRRHDHLAAAAGYPRHDLRKREAVLR